MKKIIFVSVCALMVIALYPRVFSFVYRYVPSKWWTERIAYGQVRDIYQPRNEDYQAVQKFLSNGKRHALAHFEEMRQFRLIGETRDEMPQHGRIAVNCTEDEKENCLLIYAPFNGTNPQDLKKLIDVVAKSDFKGHILYRIGGWPNVEEGDLKLAHVPHAFRPCFFREAERLGYKRALWLDPSILPNRLNQIFEEIASKGYFIVANGHFVGSSINKQAAAALKTTLTECATIPSYSTAILGIDFSNEKAAHAISQWYQAAHDPDAFFSLQSDQNALSVILYQQGMTVLENPKRTKI